MADLPTASDILSCFERHKTSAMRIAKPYRDLGNLNEAFVGGNQWGVFDRMRNQVTRDAWFDGEEGVDRAYINVMQGLMTTFSALLNKDRRSALATPTTPDDPEDIYATEITNRVIDYIANEQKTAAKIHEAVQYAFQDGTAGLKVWFDVERDEVMWSRLTIHDYWIDPVEDWHDAKWVIFENHYSEDEAEDLWSEAGREGEPPQPTQYTNAADKVEGVCGFEYWVRPCKKHPKGYFAVIIGGEVVIRKPYPIVIETEGGRVESLLPLALMKIRSRRQSAYGITPLTDVVNLQRLMNETHARTIKAMRLVTNPQIAMPKNLADEVDISKTNVIGYDPMIEDARGKIFAVEVGQISPQLFQMRDDTRKMMFDVVGLNEVTTGGQSQTLSGRAIEAYYELDAQKNSDALKSLDDMVLDAWRLCIALIQIFYQVERTAEIVRMDSIDLVTFAGKDVQGKNIRLEAASELERRTDVRTAKAVENAQAGAGSMEQVADAQKGAPNAVAKQAAALAVRTYLAGGDVEINAKDYSLPALADVIAREKSRAIASGRRSDFVDLVRLENLIREQIAPTAEQQADPEPAAPGITDTVTAPEPRA